VHSRGNYSIAGVLKDYNHQYAKKPVQPTVYFYSPGVRRYYTLDIAAGTSSLMIKRIDQAYREAFPGNPFEYFFLDDYYNAQYRVDQQFGLVFALFAGQAIFIACLGLFGLSLFTTTQRTKEMGIRKVLGATMQQVLVLLSIDFIRLVVLANLVAWPVAYWCVRKWLEGYAFRIQINPWLFVLPTLLVLLIAWLTIGFQTWKAARSNPVDALRYE
jgi:putative ABC transport system permease protein